MKPHFLLVLIVLISLVLGSGGEALASPPSSASQSSPVVTELADGLQLEWQVPFPAIIEQPDGSVLVQVPGFDSEEEPGAAELPYSSRLVALPPGASPEISIINETSTEMSLAGPLAVVPPTVRTQADGTVIDDGGAASSPTPGTEHQLVQLKDLGDLRGVRLASLTIHPVLPQAGGIKIVSQLIVEIRFNSARLQGTSRSGPEQNELASLVINPQDIASVSQPKAIAPQSVDLQPPTAAIEIASEGVYRVSGADLSAVGFPIASVDPHYLHLTRAGADIPFEWEGNENNIFEPGDSLVFYALPRFSRWSNNDVYFLSTFLIPSPVFPSRDAAVGSETAGADWFEQPFEQNTYYTPDCLCAPVPIGRDGDRWVWDQAGIQRNYQPSASRSFSFSLTNVNGSQPAVLNVWLIGNTDIPTINPDHLFQVSVNGYNLTPILQWDGKQPVQGTFNLQAGILQATNTLTFTLPGISGVNIEGAWLDAYSVQYQPGSSPWDGEADFNGSGGSGKYYQVSLKDVANLRVYDVTNPVAPVRLTNPGVNGSTISFADKIGSSRPRFAVLAGAKVKSPALIRLSQPLQTAAAAGAKLVIIAPESFAASLTSLVNLRQSQGFSPVIEYTQAIYDAYGEGIPKPDAIHAYLQDIYNRWKDPKPAYVLLVGDGSVDPKGYPSEVYPNILPSIIPPYLADFDHFSTEGATDNLYVTFGGPADIIPDMMIGRLPVKSVDELNTVVAKIVQYEANPVPGSWKNNATIVSAMPDSGGEFTTAGIVEASLLQCTIPSGKLFYPNPYTTESGVHNALMSRWNSGTGLVIFNGHASIHQWATRDQNTGNFTDFFHYNDVAALTNGNKLPVVLDMTCFTGSYQSPYLETIDEHLVLAGNGGALAAWGSTSMGLTSSHAYLARGFIAAVVSKGSARLGEATLQGKLALLAYNPASSDLLDAFNLLGDPTSTLSFNDVRSCYYTPSVFR